MIIANRNDCYCRHHNDCTEPHYLIMASSEAIQNFKRENGTDVSYEQRTKKLLDESYALAQEYALWLRSDSMLYLFADMEDLNEDQELFAKQVLRHLSKFLEFDQFREDQIVFDREQATH